MFCSQNRLNLFAFFYFLVSVVVVGLLELVDTSSGTQGQIVGARESLNGRKNMKENNKKIYIYIVPILFSAKSLKIWHEEKKRSARRTPGDNVLPDRFQTVAVILASDWCQKTFVFFCPIRRQNGGDRLELVC